MSDPTIRAAALADLEALLPMMERFNAFEGIRWSAATGRDAVTRLLSDAQLGLIGLVEQDASAVGYFVLTWGYDLEWNGRDVFLTELWLEARARRRGLGRIAMRAAMELAGAHGAAAMHLLVRDDNRAARRLYETAGFIQPKRAFMTRRLDAASVEEP